MSGKTSKPRMSWSRALTHAVIPSTLLVLAAVGLTFSGGLDKRLLWQTVVGGVLIIAAISCGVSYFIQTDRVPQAWALGATSALLVFGALYLVTHFKLEAVPRIPDELRVALRPITTESGSRLEHPLGFSIRDVAPELSPNEKLASRRYRAMGERVDTAVWAFSDRTGSQGLFLYIIRAFPYQRKTLARFVDRFVASSGATPRVRNIRWGQGEPEARVEITSAHHGEIMLRAIPVHYGETLESYLVVLLSQGIPNSKAQPILDSLKFTQALPTPGI